MKINERKKKTIVRPDLRKQMLDEFGISDDGAAYCYKCRKEILVQDVLDNHEGDFCPTEGCHGYGWGIDLYPEPWWDEYEYREDGEKQQSANVRRRLADCDPPAWEQSRQAQPLGS